MGFPDDYPEQYRESIFAHTPDSAHHERGSLTFVFTRAGSRLKVYALQYLGQHPDGDLVRVHGHGVVSDLHYDPSAEDSFVPEDMRWSRDDARLSQPVRRWLDSRDYVLATRETLLETIAEENNFEL